MHFKITPPGNEFPGYELRPMNGASQIYPALFRSPATLHVPRSGAEWGSPGVSGLTRKIRIPPHPFSPNALSAAFSVALISASPCAVDMNPASNCEGAR